MRSSLLALPLWIAFVTLLAQERILLNSERIEMRFGSYGLDVLEHGERVRISNLYSIENGQKITRTLAVVVYPEDIHAALAEPHAEILAGGSIGAVLSANGWQVDKQNRLIDTVPATDKLRAMMQRPDARALALHVYSLVAARGRTRLDYALIAEIHHPDYLATREVAAIYGPVPTLSTRERRALEAAVELARLAAAQ